MSLPFRRHWSASIVLGAILGGILLRAQTPPRTDAQDKPTFTVQVDLVTADAIVRDAKGQFVSDLTKDDFELYEDSVRQDLATMTLVHGGRVTNVLALPPRPQVEGILLPSSRPSDDMSGRVFLFFVDDLHMNVHNTAQVRDLFKRVEKTLLHDGDMFAILSSGQSSLHVDLTYDRVRFEDAVNRIVGNGLSPSEIIQTKSGADGPSEVRYRAQVAFSTVKEALANLEKVQNRRKAFVYVSEGYDLIPFQKSRSCDPSQAGGSAFQQNDSACLQNMIAQQAAGMSNGSTQPPQQGSSATNLASMGEEFADAELSRQLIELTSDANRANATFYTIDPRGLVGPLGSPGDNVDPREWRGYVMKAQSSLRVLAEETGGIAVVNTNDFDKGLKRIDADTSDYYVLGFYSKSPDPTKRTRKMEVRVNRQGVAVWSRKAYALRPPARPAVSEQR
jgi:VWFA-related protein